MKYLKQFLRHAVGKHIIEKTGNIAAVQKQLGHKNAAYSMQYARISDEELEKCLWIDENDPGLISDNTSNCMLSRKLLTVIAKKKNYIIAG